MKQYTRRVRRTRYIGGANAVPAVAPFTVIDDEECGHISTNIQNQRIVTVELMQDAITALVTRFTQQGFMDGNCVDLLSHLVCPLVWRVLEEERPDIPVAWLNYGIPAGDGLTNWPTDHECIIVPEHLEEMYLDEEWGRVVEILRGTPGFVNWLLNIVTGGPVQVQHFAGNMALLGFGVGNNLENAGAAGWENAGAAGWENAGAAGWENQMAPIHAPLSPRTVAQLDAYTPGTRAEIMGYTPRSRAMILGHGGKRNTKRKQRKNRRSTRRA